MSSKRMSLVDDVEACARDRYAELVRAVSPLACSQADAEDAVQEALARAWVRVDGGHEIDHLPAWVVTVALNLLRNRWRHLRTRRRVLEGLRRVAKEDEDREAILDLRAAIRRLPRRQQQVVVLHYLMGSPVASVATQLGVREGTVKTCLARARRNLAAQLNGRVDE